VHAKFFLKDEQVWVMDLNSLNGTSLNDVVVAEPSAMHPGDTALLGEVPVQWVAEEPAPVGVWPPASGPPPK
jgi:pSer/pThr/pTyr-binding forkhead associated (FHA) protein